jgi:putative oxidoreductase
MKNWASLPLRFGLGVIFLAHGLQKAFGAFGGPGMEGFTKFLSSLGFTPPPLWAYIAAYTELIGGLCLLLGLGTRIASGLLCVLITVATIKVHLAKGLFLSAGGFEYNLLILCGCVSLIILGPGTLSLTRKL